MNLTVHTVSMTADKILEFTSVIAGMFFYTQPSPKQGTALDTRERGISILRYYTKCGLLDNSEIRERKEEEEIEKKKKLRWWGWVGGEREDERERFHFKVLHKMRVIN